MNSIILLGRLTKDPDVRYTSQGKTVAQFTLAVDRPYKDKDGNKEADFIPVVLWGKPAELVGNSTRKGHRLLVEGRLQIRKYQGKDGNDHWATEVVAYNMEFIEKREAQPTSAPYAPQETQDKGLASLGKEVPFDTTVPF